MGSENIVRAPSRVSTESEQMNEADIDALAETLRKLITSTARGRYFPSPRSCRKWVVVLLGEAATRRSSSSPSNTQGDGA